MKTLYIVASAVGTRDKTVSKTDFLLQWSLHSRTEDSKWINNTILDIGNCYEEYQVEYVQPARIFHRL